jgi:hypothetical protein
LAAEADAGIEIVDHVLLGDRGEEVRSRNYLVPPQKREQLGAQAVTARRGVLSASH